MKLSSNSIAEEAPVMAPQRNLSKTGQAVVTGVKFFVPILIFLVFWELCVRMGWIAANIFPSPSMIGTRASELMLSSGPEQGMLVNNIIASLYRALTAFGLSLMIAIPLGFALGVSPTAYRWVSPVLSLMLPLPAVAWTPILLVSLGQGDQTIIIVCFLGAFFPVLYSTIQGVRSVSKPSVWVVRSMGGGNRHVFFNVLLPASLPALISGLKLGMAHSWRTLVAAEMLAALGAGLGYMIFAARTYMDVTTMFVGIACLAIIGMALEYGLFGTLERVTVRRWHGTSKVGGGV